MIDTIDNERIDYINKRIDLLHKSFTRKMTIFTVVILNIYFTKLWDAYMLFVNKTVEAINNILYQFFNKFSMGALINDIGLTQLLSSMFYGTGLLFAILVVLLGLFLPMFELRTINSLTNELKLYDEKYNLNIDNIEKNKIFVIFNKLMNKLHKEI